MTIAITDVVLRDAHQSLFATRLRLDDMLPIAAALDDVGYGSLECWGGATFDASNQYLAQHPWLRLR
ncbi:oxaloacetate decarboxylase, partial [Salmonella enterica subsp. enterica serovar Enteritidis]